MEEKYLQYEFQNNFFSNIILEEVYSNISF